MSRSELEQAAEARDAAIRILLHNAEGPCRRLPRAAGWAYPEPYTRDIMISALGYLTSGEPALVRALERTLEALAKNQSKRGHIPSLAHDPDDRGASDTTPLFLLALSMFRSHTGRSDFLEDAAVRAETWMSYQSPDDLVMVAQLPTSDWRDEQAVLGYGLYVNTIVYTYLRLLGRHADAGLLKDLMNRLEVVGPSKEPHAHEGLVVRNKPYYALYSYKVFNSDRFDLLGNCLAVLSGVASPTRSEAIVRWVEAESRGLRSRGDLEDELPPCLFPYIRRRDPDWRPRYERFNRPGEYHNGGIWPFICGFYVASCVAVGRQTLAERRLVALTRLVTRARDKRLTYGFNEWIRAQNGKALGQDWQTWSAALYGYAYECVMTGTTPFFDTVRSASRRRKPNKLGEKASVGDEE